MFSFEGGLEKWVWAEIVRQRILDLRARISYDSAPKRTDGDRIFVSQRRPRTQSCVFPFFPNRGAPQGNIDGDGQIEFEEFSAVLKRSRAELEAQERDAAG